jgi:hypothetical protein
MEHRLPQKMFAGNVELPDPGASGTISVDRSPCYVNLVSAAAESRTLARPTKVGASAILSFKTDGGDITLTVTGGYNENGDTTFVFANAGEFAEFTSHYDGTNYFWRLTSHHGIGNTAQLSSGVVTVTDAASYSVLAANTGKTHVIPNLTADCTLTLPTAAAGLEYTFIGKGVAADAQSWIFSTGGANFFLGGLAFVDTDDPADSIVAVYPNGSSNDFCTVAAPGGGTRIHLVCDGTNWIINGQVNGATAPTFSDT